MKIRVTQPCGVGLKVILGSSERENFIYKCPGCLSMFSNWKETMKLDRV